MTTYADLTKAWNPPADLCPVIPKTPTYKVHCRWVLTDLSQKDVFSAWAVDGKAVNQGGWEYYSDSIGHVLDYCNDLQAVGTVIDPENPHLQYSYEFEVHRLGLPLLILSGGHWSAIGDDYLDPYCNDSTEDCEPIGGTLALTNF